MSAPALAVLLVFLEHASHHLPLRSLPAFFVSALAEPDSPRLPLEPAVVTSSPPKSRVMPPPWSKKVPFLVPLKP